jgi:hypothetical protein
LLDWIVDQRRGGCSPSVADGRPVLGEGAAAMVTTRPGVDGVLEAALQAVEFDPSPLPVRADGSKAPDLDEWTPYRSRRATPTDIRKWYALNPSAGLGIACGAVSGNLEAIDFDDMRLLEPLLERARSDGIEDVLRRIANGYSDRTPDGAHLLYRCAAISGNTRLARRSKQLEEMKGPNDRVKVLIETRGEGGYIITAPSCGTVHKSGRPYVLTRGGFFSIAEISPDERAAVWALCGTFDAVPKTEYATPSRDRHDRGVRDDRPGDDFNRRASWHEVLEPHAWTPVRQVGDTTYWRKPGKHVGHQATTNHGGYDPLYVFSTSAPIFDPEVGYSKFSAFSLLNHGGDFASAARKLAQRGYGTSRSAIGPRGHGRLVQFVEQRRPWAVWEQSDG